MQIAGNESSHRSQITGKNVHEHCWGTKMKVHANCCEKLKVHTNCCENMKNHESSEQIDKSDDRSNATY